MQIELDTLPGLGSEYYGKYEFAPDPTDPNNDWYGHLLYQHFRPYDPEGKQDDYNVFELCGLAPPAEYECYVETMSSLDELERGLDDIADDAAQLEEALKPANQHRYNWPRDPVTGNVDLQPYQDFLSVYDDCSDPNYSPLEDARNQCSDALQNGDYTQLCQACDMANHGVTYCSTESLEAKWKALPEYDPLPPIPYGAGQTIQNSGSPGTGFVPLGLDPDDYLCWLSGMKGEFDDTFPRGRRASRNIDLGRRRDPELPARAQVVDLLLPLCRPNRLLGPDHQSRLVLLRRQPHGLEPGHPVRLPRAQLPGAHRPGS